MPRSFLVKKPSSHKTPNYGRLETWAADAPEYFKGERPAVPFRKEAADPDCRGTHCDRSSVITRISLDMGVKETYRCNPPLPEIRLDSTLQHQALLTPLTDTLNNLNLPSPLIPKHTHELVCFGGPALEETEQQNISAVGPQESLGGFDCRRSYHMVSGLAKHRQLHCDLYSRKNFSCKYCEKEYSSLGALKMHIRTHTLPCVCRICSKAFSRPWLLQGHIRTHTGEKPFTCPHCSRAFADRSNLRAHLQTHSDIKKYQCRGCSKTFSRISLLSKHQDTGCSALPPASPPTSAQSRSLEPRITTRTALEQPPPLGEYHVIAQDTAGAPNQIV